jgi:peptidoglycan/xylan/chitin deacetylase (PgdA/CDA1 family)
MFHKVALPPPGTRDPFDYTSPATLERKLGALYAAGFRPSNLDELRSEMDRPAGRFVVTFDDGYASVAERALPALQRHNVRAIVFLVAGKLGGRNDWDIAKGDVAESLMDAAQIKTWLAAGHQIGSHSLTHPNLRKISSAAAREEIAASRKLLEDVFGVAVEHFCYPYGAGNEEIRDLVGEAGYQTACTVKFGLNVAGASPFELKRIQPLTGGELIRKVFHRLRRKILRS